MVRVLADEAIPFIEPLLGDVATIKLLPAPAINHAACEHADILIVRSITKVNHKLLNRTPVKLVASATIGLDHIDIDELNTMNINVVNAPGCNAQGVVQYVLGGIAHWSCVRQKRLADLTVGVVGVGHIGTRLIDALAVLGIRSLGCDPIRAQQGWTQHHTLDQLMAQCDLISFHTPLTRGEPDATEGIINAQFLAGFNGQKLLINSARGQLFESQCCLHQPSLYSWLMSNDLITDVWPQEPIVDKSLLDRVFIGTPHIAGYSLEGKTKASIDVAAAIYQWIGCEPRFARSSFDEPSVNVAMSANFTLEQTLRGSFDPTPLYQAMLNKQPIRPVSSRQRVRWAAETTRIDISTLRNRYSLRRDFSGQVWLNSNFESVRKIVVDAIR